MPPPQRKSEIRRAAVRAFAGQGFDQSTMRDVAAACSMSLAGLYHYYRGKEEMLFDIQREAFETILDRHAEELAGIRSAEDKLRRVIRVHVGYVADHPAEMTVLGREGERLTGEFADSIGELRRRYGRLVQGIVREVAGGRLDGRALSNSVLLLFGMMNWMYTWYDPARSGRADEIADTVYGIFRHGLLGVR
ncbi:MAG: TetR/AcrR family transcriptional regulator [Planctomycetota bacterium]